MIKSGFNARVIMREGEFLPLSDCEVPELHLDNSSDELAELFTWSMPDSIIELLSEMGHSSGHFSVSGSVSISYFTSYFGDVDSEVIWDDLSVEVIE